MSKYAISGANGTLLDATLDASTTGTITADPTALLHGRDVLGRAPTTGRVFWLRSFWAYDASAAVTLVIHDSSAGVSPASTTIKAKIRCASNNTTFVEWPKPGLRFATGCVVSKAATDVSNGFVPGEVGGAGYEEG